MRDLDTVPVASAAAAPAGCLEGGPRLRRTWLAGWRNRAQLVGLALPVVLLAARAWDRRWLSDDGMINLRVVDQLLAGHGPVFNAGERVEAATSPLWIALLAFGDVTTPMRLEWIAVTVGIGLSLVGVAAASAGSARLWAQASDGVVVPVGALCLVALSPVWDFSSSGLEGGLSFCWLGVCFLLLQRWAASNHAGPAAAAIVVGIGPVIRPDFAVISVVLVGALLVGERGAAFGRRLRIIGLAAAIPGAYELFRIAYYGALVPNTYFAKEGGESNWSQGWLYLRDFVGPYRLWLPLLGLALTAVVPLLARLHRQMERRAILVVVAFPVAGVVSALAIVRGGGDFMHARLLLPSLFAVVAPAATVAIRGRTVLVLGLLPWATLSLFAFEPPRFTPDQLSTVNDHRSALHTMLGARNLVTNEDFGFAPGGVNYFEFDEDHRLYYGQTPLEIDGRPVPLAPGAPDRVLLAYGVGAISYFAGPDTYVLDMLGLGDTLSARLELDERGTLPGHEKALPTAWVWARYIDPSVDPDPTLFGPPVILADVSPTLDPRHEGELAAEINAAHAVLECADVMDLTESAKAPLGLRRVLDNLSHSIRSFTLRIPPRPTDAQRTVC